MSARSAGFRRRRPAILGGLVEGDDRRLVRDAIDGRDDQHRSRVVGRGGGAHGGADLTGGARGVAYAHDRAGNASEHALDADALGSDVLREALAGRRPGHVAADHHHGDALQVRGHDAGDHVRRAGAGGHDHRGHAPAGAVEPHRLERARGLVARLVEARPAALQHGVEHQDDRPARDPEEGLDAERRQRGDDGLDSPHPARARALLANLGRSLAGPVCVGHGGLPLSRTTARRRLERSLAASSLTMPNRCSLAARQGLSRCSPGAHSVLERAAPGSGD